MRTVVTQKGFTLIELLVVLVVLGIFVIAGVPAMNGFIEKNRVRGAAEVVASEFQLARSEAIKRGRPISVSFNTVGVKWCFGTDENPGCDCTVVDVNQAGACTLEVGGKDLLKVTSSDAYKGVSVLQNFSGGTATFDHVRGSVNTGSVVTTSPGGLQMQVQVSALGRIGICSVNIPGYPPC